MSNPREAGTDTLEHVVEHVGALELAPPPWQVFPHQARVSDTPITPEHLSPNQIN